MAFLTAEKLQSVKENTGADRRYLAVGKLPDGQPIRLRVVGEGITGYVAWTEAKKPLRWEVLPDVLPENIRQDDNGDRSAKFFLTGIVWDYDNEIFRVMELTQKKLISDMYKYMADEDYGDPSNYDIIITRTGSGLETKYDLLPKPPTSFADKAPEAVKIFKTLGWDLRKLYEGKHPWAEEGAEEVPF